MPQTETVVQRLCRLKAERAAQKEAAIKATKEATAAALATAPAPEKPKRVRVYVPKSQYLYDAPDPKWRPLSGDARIELDAAVERMGERLKKAPATFKASLTALDYRHLRHFCLEHQLPIPRCNKRGGRPKPVFIQAIRDYVDTFELLKETAPPETVLPAVKQARASAARREEEAAAAALAAEEATEEAEPEATGADAWTLFQTLVGQVDAGNDSPVLKLRIRRLISEVVKDGLLTRDELPGLQHELGLKFTLG